jgi:hypothetical protein
LSIVVDLPLSYSRLHIVSHPGKIFYIFLSLNGHLGDHAEFFFPQNELK